MNIIVASNRISEIEANAYAAIYYPENPRGIGTPVYICPVRGTTTVLKAQGIYRDPLDRGVWLHISGDHLIPCAKRS